METRAQTVKRLLEDIIAYNKLKHREYYELSLDIQKEYCLDDYIDMLSHMENRGNTFSNNMDAVDELSDTDLLKLEQMLSYTAEFIGIKTNTNPTGTGYQAIQAEFHMFNYLDFIDNPLEMLLYFIDPKGEHIRRMRNSFPMMSESEQMNYLKEKYREGMSKTGRNRGRIAEELRSLRGQMKLEGLFNMNNRFMNVELRDFLNLNENGTDIYTWQEIQKDGWQEYSSLLSQYHQMTAPNTKRLLAQRTGGLVYIRLNAKFGHPDGREIVFAYKSANDGLLITDYPDKGTYNYGDGIFHAEHDVKPYKDLMKEYKENQEGFNERMNLLIEQNDGDKANISGKNSDFWKTN